MEEYYYNQMEKQQKSVYHAMKTGFAALEPSFAVVKMEGRELTDIFFKLRLDHPELFYAVSFKYRFYPNAANVEVVPEYLFDRGKIKEQQAAMRARVDKLVRGFTGTTEWEKEEYIHDFICDNVRYDKLKKPYSHEIIGPLGHGVGVCEGIAKTVKILCDGLGIWCIIGVSDANPEKNIKYRHAWNVVKINGSYYHLDVTFDNSLSRGDSKRHDYFNLEDKQFFRDHEPALYVIPVCGDGSHFYYKEKKLSFTKEEEVAKRALQALKKKKPFLFHWRGSLLTREKLSELLALLKETAGQKGMYASVSLNWTQAVFYVIFGEANPSEECVVEEADEGQLL